MVLLWHHYEIKCKYVYHPIKSLSLFYYNFIM